MKKHSILFYGDSNTYGYDPADWSTYRYPYGQRWTSILQERVKEKWTVQPEGMNGRTLPVLKYEKRWILSLLNQLENGDCFAVMLGTNDLLQSMQSGAEAACSRMEAFLDFLNKEAEGIRIFVIAPPHIGDKDAADPLFRRWYAESCRMNEGFCKLAGQYHAGFADAASWDIPLVFDRVHFSEEGHRQFAERMSEILMSDL